jgi:glucosamine-phosphate N-acetyltransferase
MSIRKLEINDYEKYLNLISQFRKTFFSKNSFEIILQQLHNTDIWIIEFDNEIIASATILYEYKFIHNINKIGHIEDVIVDEKYRNQHYGKILITHLIEQAQQKNCYKITLNCIENLESFYKSCGLNKTGIEMSLKFL